MKKSKILTNAAILTATGFILRGLGMVLRVYISKKIGEEGMGLYQLIQTVYFLFITVAQSGIAVAATRCLSSRVAVGDTVGAQSVTSSALKLSTFLGTLSCVIMSALSSPICRLWIGDTRCISAVSLLSLSLPFVAVCGVLSAYFIVYENALFGCISQIIEQVTRIGLIALLTMFSSPKSVKDSLVIIVFANVISEAVSCLFLIVCYISKKQKLPHKSYSKEIVSNAVPVAASRYLASALRTAENVLVPNAITVFTKDRETALSQFGALKGMAIPLLFFPYSFLSAITTLLVPKVTGAQAQGNKKSLRGTTERVCFVTLFSSIVTAGIFFTLADFLGMAIYKSQRVSQMILWLAPIVPFMYLDSVCDGLLKGLGKQKEVLLHGSIDSALRIVLICIFVPHYGIVGFLGVMVVSNIFVSLMNFYTLCKTTDVKFTVFNRLLRPTVATFISSLLTNFLSNRGAISTNPVAILLVFSFIFVIFYGFFWLLKIFKKIKVKSALF